MVTRGYNKLEEVTGGYQGLPRVTRGHSGLQGLKGVTVGYRK